jgi:hypothetical protein
MRRYFLRNRSVTDTASEILEYKIWLKCRKGGTLQVAAEEAIKNR